LVYHAKKKRKALRTDGPRTALFLVAHTQKALGGPLGALGVVQNHQGVVGAVALAPPDHTQVVQRNQVHRHVGHQNVTLDLHDALHNHTEEDRS
jgi:predicted alpha/beta hydrolase family esterase